MKAIPYKLFKNILDTIVSIYVIAGFISLLFLIYQASKPEHEIKFGISKSYNLNLDEYNCETTDIESNSSMISEVKLAAQDWRLSFRTSDPILKWGFTFLGLLVLLYVGILLFILRKFVQSIETDSTFSEVNFRRLRLLAYLIIPIDIFKWIVSSRIDDWLINTFSLPVLDYKFSVFLGYKVGSQIATFDFFYNSIALGLLVLFISEVFRQGVMLRQEQDLTV